MKNKKEIFQSVWTRAGKQIQTFVKSVKENKCNACGNCAQVCPKNVFRFVFKPNNELVAKVANQDNCVGCASCLQVCPHKALKMQTLKITEPNQIKSDKISGLSFGGASYVQGFLQKVDIEKCNGCARCTWACSKNCYNMDLMGEKIVAKSAEKEKCLGDGACHKVCPTNAIICSSLDKDKFF